MADAAAATEALLPHLPDAHAHPQLDADNWRRTASLRVPCVAAMGVAANVDWARVERLASSSSAAAASSSASTPSSNGADATAAATTEVIPGFGVHPWWSHLHASEVGSSWAELLEGRSEEDVPQAVALLEDERRRQRRRRQEEEEEQQQQQRGVGNDGAQAADDAAERYERHRRSRGPDDGARDSSSSSSEDERNAAASTSGGGADNLGGGGSGGGGGPLDLVPHDEWRSRLRSLLLAHPGAIVGEVGIDRAAVIPGSRAKVRLDHQMALLREQLALAAELRRPASVHCVRGNGHLLQLFEDLIKTGGGVVVGDDEQQQQQQDPLPPAIMMHSYGGSAEDVKRFASLPRGFGARFFFSFSAAINGSARAPRDKLLARIRAVPDDRLLLESDQVTPLAIDAGMAEVCAVVAAAKGWTLEETARRTKANFGAFYSSVRPLDAAAAAAAAPGPMP